MPSVTPIRNKFRELMDIEFNDVWDKFFLMMQKVAVDPIKLDDILIKRFGDYNEDKKSMKDILTEKYGKEACELVESLL